MKKKNKTLSRFPTPIYPSGNISGKAIYTNVTWYSTLDYISGVGDSPTVVSTYDGDDGSGGGGPRVGIKHNF